MQTESNKPKSWNISKTTTVIGLKICFLNVFGIQKSEIEKETIKKNHMRMKGFIWLFNCN
jgi:hypothetical protein